MLYLRVEGSGAGRSKFPPFRKLPKKQKSGTPLEAWHLAWCLIICVPTCTVVCLIVDKVFGG